MPSSWSESNRLHSSNQRETAADDKLHTFFMGELDEDYEDGAPDDSYLDGDFDYHDSFNEPEDRYLDAAYEDRYYLPEPEFDY